MEATFGMVLSPYGLPVPRIAQMAFCVESCAQLGITAYANGVFGVVAMSVDYFNQLNARGGDALAVEIEYAEPEAAGDMWKLRVSLSCGRKKLQGMGDARGPQVGDVTGSVGPSNSSEGGRNAGSAESGAENGAKFLAKLRKRIRSLKWRLKRSINQGGQNKHIEGTNENKQARAMKKDPKSTWDNSAEANDRTVEAWVHGTPVRNNPLKRKFNFGRRVGTARDGCGNARHGQSHVTTQMANGGMHGTPSGPPV